MKSDFYSPKPSAQDQTPSPSALQPFLNRRQASGPLPTSPLEGSYYFSTTADTMAGHFAKNNPGALGELQHNQQESAPRFPRNSRDEYKDDSRGRSQSPIKNKFPGGMEWSRMAKSREASPTKPKKAKSGANLAGLLRPKSLRNLSKLVTDDDIRLSKDKENRTPDEPMSAPPPPPPIFAQFTSDPSFRQNRDGRSSVDVARNITDQDLYTSARSVVRERPKSYQVLPQPMPNMPASPTKARQPQDVSRKSSKGSNGDKSTNKTSRTKVLSAFTTFSHGRSKSTSASPTPEPAEKVLDPRDVDKHLEAMLDRRNIPENQRYKMRNLNSTIKMEFIRQDWAEMQSTKADRPGTTDSRNSNDSKSAVAQGSDNEEKPKRTRGKSFTLSRGKKEQNSPTKKTKGDGTIGRHFRSKSTDSVSAEPTSSSTSTTSSVGILSKIKLQQGPADYVAYLRKVQKPELVEVGKIHKLRLLLRNETVAWIEDFIQQGGMKEIVGLLNRIMDVEWREEHEDALLHENLLCLKGLSTTARGMQYLHTIQGDLFPKLLHMLFDPERKGPSEFTTRGIITSVLFTYIETAPPAERVLRAKSILGHLRDPEQKEDEQPLPFVMEMRRDRPYRIWCREVVSVTKEVFWIFLHNLNVVALPSDKGGPSAATSFFSSAEVGPYSYMLRNFPQERPPVPAAPYVGGVEWDATNYLASHLDLMNAILACTATADERNTLRADFRISGWERCLGGSLRLCKEKFYGSVHDGLRTWVAAAAEDNWYTKDVRYGPPPESMASPRKAGGGQQKNVEPAPKIEIPKLDLGLEKSRAPKDDEWL
ncbi:Fc.00g060370.m01.CDS01 [Cosmosporella sp. VM-42]